MGTDVIKSCELELEKLKTNLKEVVERERRISGRDERRSEGFQRNERKRSSGFDGQPPRQRNDYNNYNQTERTDRRFDPPSKRRLIDTPKPTKSVFSRLSGPTGRDEDDSSYVKPRLNSRVIKEQPTRQEILAAQGADAQSIARNRRMFAGLLGTLQKFCQEESRLKPREEKKAKIEKRLEEQEKLERENLKKEKQNLFVDKKRKQLEIKMVEIKMLKLKDFSAWEELQRPLLNFVRTRTRPHIYYMPKTLNKETQEKQKKFRTDMEEIIEKRREEVNEEIAKIEEKFRSEIKAIEEGLHEIPENNSQLKHDRNNRNEDESDNDDYDNSDVENGAHAKRSREQIDVTMDTNEDSLYDGDAKNLKITIKYEKHSDDDDEDRAFSRQVVHDED